MSDAWWSVRHTAVAAVGAAAQVATILQPAVHGTAQRWVEVVLAVATALGVHLAPKVAPTPSGDPKTGVSA